MLKYGITTLLIDKQLLPHASTHPSFFVPVAWLPLQVPLMPPVAQSLIFVGPGLNPWLNTMKIIPGRPLNSGGNLILRVSLGTDRKDHLRNYCAYNLPPELNFLGTAQVHPTPFASPSLTNLVFDYPFDDLIFLSCSPSMRN